MRAFQLTLILATLLCTLVAGVVFAFAVVVMPGIRNLSDGGFLASFQAMDRVIQNRQPLFALVWLGSVVALVAAVGLGFGRLDGTGRALLAGATALYLLGVQLPTFVVNIPLNNAVQALDVEAMDDAALQAARGRFEARWNASNSARTVVACLVSVMLLVVVLRLE